jgi:hypothetical protein
MVGTSHYNKSHQLLVQPLDELLLALALAFADRKLVTESNED